MIQCCIVFLAGLFYAVQYYFALYNVELHFWVRSFMTSNVILHDAIFCCVFSTEAISVLYNVILYNAILYCVPDWGCCAVQYYIE